MPTLILVNPAGEESRVLAAAGTTVMLAAVQGNVAGIDGECGGCLSCSTCHVYVDVAWLERLPPIEPDEADMLEFVAAERRPTSRLGCQIELGPALDGLRVTIPERQV